MFKMYRPDRRSSVLMVAALACPLMACGASSSGPGGSGTGGATAGGTGGRAAGSGGATTTGSGGASASGGTTGSGGGLVASGGTTAATGGITGSGGASTATGGSGFATGGSTGSGGAVSATGGATGSGGSGSGCPGVPITPDANGLVAMGTNTLGIHGSWFEYSDCKDLGGKNCSTVTTPPVSSFPNVGGKMCTSGHTSMATGAWGAGIALELNDLPPQQPYDTVAHGVKGFCFQLSGTTIPSTTIRVAFPTKNNPDNVYFSPVSTPGMHTVLFSDTAQGSWVTTKSAFEPNLVMLLQFQIPATPTAPVPWDFCIEGLTAITQ